MKRVKLFFSFACLMVVIGTGLSVTMLPWGARAVADDCRCQMAGNYYYESAGAGDCQWLCED